jgi:hypothetical protein
MPNTDKPTGPDPNATPDLTPEEVARLFPDQPSPTVMNEADAATLRPYENMPEADPMAGLAGAREGATAASLPETGGGGELDTEADLATTGDAGQPTTTAMAGDDTFVIPEEFGPKAESSANIRKDLPPNPDLVKLYVTDERLRQRFGEIESLEKQIAVQPGLSLGMAREMFERLAQARTYLLADRGFIEEAEREMAEAHYRFSRIQRMSWFEVPRVLFGYLVLVLIVIVGVVIVTGLGQLIVEGLSATVVELTSTQPVPPVVLWLAILCGGVGGVVGGLFVLWTHVAEKKDFDPEFAMWYYAYPLVGLVFGLLIYGIARSNVITLITNNQYIIYILAFTFGFYQNLMIRLLNKVLRRLVPKDEK